MSIITTMHQKTCQAPGCERTCVARSLCGSHYKQGQVAKDFTFPLRDPWPLTQTAVEESPCKIRTCDRPCVTYKGYCKAHYNRLQKTGSVQADKPIEKRGSERPYESTHGYMVVLVRQDQDLYPGKRVTQHRLVMARHLGRELTSTETVHHKNGIRTDNRLENLELWVGNHSHGSRLEDRLEDAVTLIEEYHDDLTQTQIARLRGED
jgi:hypothetical protein